MGKDCLQLFSDCDCDCDYESMFPHIMYESLVDQSFSGDPFSSKSVAHVRLQTFLLGGDPSFQVPVCFLNFTNTLQPVKAPCDLRLPKLFTDMNMHCPTAAATENRQGTHPDRSVV